jgi:Fe-S cluster assembly iron-binding protein IscA
MKNISGNGEETIMEKVDMIRISETAAEKLSEIKQKQNNPENVMLRVSFGGHG